MRSPRHLLRDISENVFYKGQGEWTADAEKAKDFSDQQELIAIWESCAVTDAEVVEHLPGGHFDVHLPVDACGEFFPGKRD